MTLGKCINKSRPPVSGLFLVGLSVSCTPAVDTAEQPITYPEETSVYETTSETSTQTTSVSTTKFLPQTSRSIIHELHINPDIKTEPLEFVELYNDTDDVLALSQWYFCDGISYTFPDDVALGPGEYLVVAEDPVALREAYVVESDVYGPFTGKLKNSGEAIALCSDDGLLVSKFDYGLGFPWPTVGGPVSESEPGTGFSMQLQRPDLDSRHPGSWRSGAPTPGTGNAPVFTENTAPLIDTVSHWPFQPRSKDSVAIEAVVFDADGIDTVTLQYQIVRPGHYVPYAYFGGPDNRVLNSAYEEGWVDVPMVAVDDEDDLFRGDIPADVQVHRNLIRYRIVAVDSTGVSLQVPYADDPQPNFAYFVYDDVPAWTGSDRPGVTDPVTYDEDVMASLPVYHLIATAADINESQYTYIDYMGAEAGWYQWTGALVYDGVVYDHIWFRTRGWWSAYEWGKNKWKFDFNRGHGFQARDDNGAPYAETWDKMNFSACITPVDYNPHRGEQGMFEAMTYRLFDLVGVPSPRTHWLQLRVIDDEQESTANQYEGDFWGMYMVIEQPDGQFLDANGLPDGNTYKMAGVTPHEWTSHTNQGASQVSDMSDLWDFIDTYQTGPPQGWWESNADIESYLSYRVIVDAVHHYDIPDGWNSVYYHHPGDDKRPDHWVMLPWDVDLTWDGSIYANDTEQFFQVVYFQPYEIALQNRAREISDLLFNADQGAALVRELAGHISDVQGGPNFVAADRAMWDYHPRNTRPGMYYKNPAGDFGDMVDYMTSFMDVGGWGYSSIQGRAYHPDVPRKPVVTYIGSSDYDPSDLVFEVDDFADPQGPGTFEALEWRLAEVGDGFYEIQSTWESGDIFPFSATLSLPSDLCQPGHTYRVRARMRDSTGRTSHWSEPIEFKILSD